MVNLPDPLLAAEAGRMLASVQRPQAERGQGAGGNGGQPGNDPATAQLGCWRTGWSRGRGRVGGGSRAGRVARGRAWSSGSGQPRTTRLRPESARNDDCVLRVRVELTAAVSVTRHTAAVFRGTIWVLVASTSANITRNNSRVLAEARR